LRDKIDDLRYWCRKEYQRRTKAIADGTATMSEQLAWANSEYRVRFSEVQAKAEDMGIDMNIVDLRLALQDCIK
jgi:hypothetical protein